jgi:hypothetical protein
MKSISIFLSVVLVLSAASCHKPTEEDKVRKVIIDVRKATEEKEIRTVLGLVSKSYRDPQGYDREGIKGLLAYYFFRHQKVSVFIPGFDVWISNGKAQAKFQAILSGGEKTGTVSALLPEALGVYDFDVSFAKEDGEWKVTSAVWKRVGDTPASSTNP